MDNADVSLSSDLHTESYNSALCLLPPRSTWSRVDRFRVLNDKGYGRWPPHVNLIYPFVPHEHLDQAARKICQIASEDLSPLRVSLTQADSFAQKHENSIHLRPAEGDRSQDLVTLVQRLNQALGRTEGKPFQPHLTVAQSTSSNTDAHEFLLDKARLLTPLEWEYSELAILVREEYKDGQKAARVMRLWGTLDIASGRVNRETGHLGFYDSELTQDDQSQESLARPQTGFGFSEQTAVWGPLPSDDNSWTKQPLDPLSRLIVASYNVLAEFDWPPASTRYPHLVRNICSTRAEADILVLQEVTDAFLEHLLSDATVCKLYPFATHGRPRDSSVGPLPNLLNIVVLSKFPMQWEYVEHSRKHKGSAIVNFPTLRMSQGNGEEPRSLVLAACHLSQGLTDGAAAAKKQEVQGLMKRLQNVYPEQPWLLAGDFNITTSSFTVSMAKKKEALSNRALQTLRDIDGIFYDHGFRDVWMETRLESGESSGAQATQENLGQLHEGEQGATFDPQVNTLAAKQTGYGMNTRPQRYDRIFVSESFGLHPSGFNMFGQETMKPTDDQPAQHASDHWGVRCLLQTSPSDAVLLSKSAPTQGIELCQAAASLEGSEGLRRCLSSRGLIPTPEEEQLRTEAIELLRRVLTDELTSRGQADSQFKPTLVLVPVGSTALGVWTSSSDVDCLCIGGISSKTFFALALRRLRQATAEGIAILRKVRANSGTMLELIVKGLRFDLQYCPSISIAEQ